MSVTRISLIGAGVALTDGKQLSPSSLLNVYEEQLSGVTLGKTDSGLIKTFGTRFEVLVKEGGEFKGWKLVDDLIYVVFDDNLYSLNANNVVTLIDTIDSGNSFVTLEDNGAQLGIFSDAEGNYMPYSSGIVTNISDGDYTGLNYVKYDSRGRGIYVKPGTDEVYVSDILDFSSWDITMFASAESNTALSVCALPTIYGAYIFGVQNTEVWVPTTDLDYPYVPNSGAHIPYGLEAIQSALIINGFPVWLGKNSFGKRNIITVENGKAKLLLDATSAQEIQSLAVVSDAYAATFEINGHIFYAITFPTEEKSYLYDFSTKRLTRWASWIPYIDELTGNSTYRLGKHIFRDILSFNNKIYVADNRATGRILVMDKDIFTDFNTGVDNSIPIEIITPPIYYQDKRITFNQLLIDCEKGVSPYSDLELAQDATLPQPILRISMSKDGGRTFNYNREINLGTLGNYKKRLKLSRWGSASSAVFKFSFSHPSYFGLYNVWVDVDIEDGQPPNQKNTNQ